jgi:enediyne biosynthesis protein E4
MAHARAVTAALCVWGAMIAAGTRGAESPIVLHDVTSETGINFRHSDGSRGQYHIIEYVSAGLALFDYDGDNLIDIYFLNGAPLEFKPGEKPPKDALYRNEGNWHFKDVTEQSGLGDTRHGLGVAAADYDNDGDQDLYVNNCGPNVLYTNQGDGTFIDQTQTAGVGNGQRVGAAVCFLDADSDGALDLFVANYIKFSLAKHGRTTFRGVSAYPSPLAYEPDTNTFYHNSGDGTFTDASVSSGIGTQAGTGMGAVCADFDNDGDTDIFVCNDMTPNFLFQNDGTGVFSEVALFQGTAFDATGRAQGSMGVDCADYDNDGWLDFMHTCFQDEVPVLYHNSGQGYFDDVSRVAGAGTTAVRKVTWGVGFADFDNDGDKDIFIATGHLEDNVALKDDTIHYETQNILLRNDGGGKFTDVSSQSGDGMLVTRCSRGIGLDDLDNDGDIDVVVLNSRREPTILRNDSAHQNHWLQLRLQGTAANRDAVGARVKVTAGKLVQIDEVHSGRGYQSHHGTRLHFGLGPQDRVDAVEVHWPGGQTEVFSRLQVDRVTTLIQGSGAGR